MKTNWTDFKVLRANLDFARVLEHYGVTIKTKGKQHHGHCPLPNHQGTQRSPSFSASLERGIFQCFHCGGKGNVLDFAVLMENLNPDNGDDVRTVALKLQQEFGLESAKPEQPAKSLPGPARLPKEPAAAPKPIVVNAPLDFELKRLDPNHPYACGSFLMVMSPVKNAQRKSCLVLRHIGSSGGSNWTLASSRRTIPHSFFERRSGDSHATAFRRSHFLKHPMKLGADFRKRLNGNVSTSWTSLERSTSKKRSCMNPSVFVSRSWMRMYPSGFKGALTPEPLWLVSN